MACGLPGYGLSIVTMACGLPGYGLSIALRREFKSGADSPPSCRPKRPRVGLLPPGATVSLRFVN